MSNAPFGMAETWILLAAACIFGRAATEGLFRMNRNAELGHFLRSRRQRLTPTDVGLSGPDRSRRVAGLRRGELANLAGISIDYYTRMEQGRARNASPQVLDALADALRLDDVERNHLYILFDRRPVVRGDAPTMIRKASQGLRATVDALDPVPAFIHNLAWDVLFSNRAAASALAAFCDLSNGRGNLARWMFGDARAREVVVDWESASSCVAATLRAATALHGDDADLTDLVRDLTSTSAAFAAAWEEHRLGLPSVCPSLRLRVEPVGELVVAYQSLSIPEFSGLHIAICTAAPGSASEEKLETLTAVRAGLGR